MIYTNYQDSQMKVKFKIQETKSYYLTKVYKMFSANAFVLNVPKLTCANNLTMLDFVRSHAHDRILRNSHISQFEKLIKY